MTRFLLLNALIPQDFGITIDELREAAQEFGCDIVASEGLRDIGSIPATQAYYFLTASTKEAMEAMVTSVDLSGIMVEYSTIYDQEEHITKIIK